MAVVNDAGRVGGRGFPVRSEHVGALVASVLKKSPDVQAVGIRAAGPWLGGDTVLVAGETHPVAVCGSVLALCEALSRQESSGSGLALVLITPLAEDELGWDVLVRLAKRRLLDMVPWDIVRDLFHARDVDPRITAHRWMAEALLEHVPAGGYAPVASGVLDADTAWAHVLGQMLGLRGGRSDADLLLEASSDPGLAIRYGKLPVEVRAAIGNRVEETAGRLGSLLVGALEAGSARSLLAIGLVAEVLFQADAPAGGEISRAAVRLETYSGSIPIEPELGRRWFEASHRAIDGLTDAQRSFTFQQAEELLCELRADAFVGLSTVLPTSYDRRLADFGREITAFLMGEATSGRVQAVLDRVEEHRNAQRDGERERRGRLHMALRLVRFLETRQKTGPTKPRTLADATSAYLAEGSYVDWARSLLLGGDQAEALATALDQLSDRVREIREEENRSFAERLAEWNRSPSPGVLPVENVLDEVLAPAAAEGPVLLLVLDGMSIASYRQLRQDVRAAGWEEWLPEGRTGPVAALAAVPSITRVSRASLFAGRLTTGAAADESRSFKKNPALATRSRASKLPVLFHKGSLAEGGASGLSDDVRGAIRDKEQRVVGIVLNVLDDSLAKSDQVVPRWTADRIRLLESILFEARLSGRLVVFTSDHGHVLDSDTVAIPGGDEERWRTSGGPVAETEVTLSGPRIQAATGVPEIVAPWSERVRYVRKKAGYHGGATPQEMLVPVAVLAAWDREVAGWTVAAEQPPRWWQAEPEVVEPTPMPLAESRPIKRTQTSPVQASLFADPAESAPPPPSADWISALLDSSVFAAQREIAGRMAPPDTTVRAFLEVMGRYHGRAPRTALARALGQPDIRIRGIVAGLQRLLNVDGYPIVAADEVIDSVELQRDLLRRQFQLEVIAVRLTV